MKVMSVHGNLLKNLVSMRNSAGSVEKFYIGDKACLTQLRQYTVSMTRQVVQCCCGTEPSN